MKRLLFGLLFAGFGAVLYAQNPTSILQIGPSTAVTTTIPVSGTVTANAGTGTLTVGQATGSNLHVVVDTAPSTAVTNAGTFAVQAAESGTWNITNVSGTVSLPTGASTAAKQPALGTAGSASTDVLTIQGIASMTKLLVTPDSVALPANQSVNVAQLAGTTTDTNSGSKSAGTLRVVLATDQPALTNKLLVTPDSVALPANQSVNISQMNGVTVTMGAGATGTGVQRINDVGSSATGAAPPASASYVGGLQSGATGGFLGGITVCDLSKPINVSTATTTLMVTGVSGRQVRICSFHMVTAAANNVAWLEGTGATCGTGTAGMAGGTSAASGYNFAANGGIALGSGLGEVLTTATTGDSVCLITSAGTQLSGFIKYTIY